MNIEQIAREVSAQMSKEAKTMAGHVMLAEFLRRCLSKLAEQDVEPVAYQSTRNGFISRENKNPEYNVAIYTEAQLIAAQQKVAEACAKVCEKYAYDDDDEFVVAIRNGEWRKYL